MSLSADSPSEKSAAKYLAPSLATNIGGGVGGANIDTMGSARGTDGHSLVADTFSLDTSVVVGADGAVKISLWTRGVGKCGGGMTGSGVGGGAATSIARVTVSRRRSWTER
jgi:hypothetical protein